MRSQHISPLLLFIIVGQTREFGLEGGEDGPQVVGGAQEARDVRQREQRPLELAQSAYVSEHRLQQLVLQLHFC